MKDKQTQIETLEQVLFHAGRRIAPVTPGTRWQSNLMRQVRLTEPLSGRKEDTAVYGRVVWRVAISAAACAAMLFILAERKGGLDNYVSERVELDNSFEYMLADAF